MVQYAAKYEFPKPTFIDLIKFEVDDNMEEAFILHYKNASNGNAWQSDEYNSKKQRLCLRYYLNYDCRNC